MSDVESDDEEMQPSRQPPPLLLKLETTAGCSYIQQGTIPAQSFLAPYSMPSQFPISSSITNPTSNIAQNLSTTSTPRDSGIAFFPSVPSLSQSALIPPESVKVENFHGNGSVIPVYIPLSSTSLGTTSGEYSQPSLVLPFATKNSSLQHGSSSVVGGSARTPFFSPAIWQGTAGLPFAPSHLYSDRTPGPPAHSHLTPLMTRAHLQPISKHGHPVGSVQVSGVYSQHEPSKREESSRHIETPRQPSVHKVIEVPIPVLGASSPSSVPYQTASTVIQTERENCYNTSVPLVRDDVESPTMSHPAVLPRYIVPEHVLVKEKETSNTVPATKKSVSSLEQFLRSKLQEPSRSSPDPVDVEDPLQALIKCEPHLSSFCNLFKASKHSKYLRMRLLNTKGSANIVKWIEVTRSTSHIDGISGPVDVVRILVSSNGLCKLQLLFPCCRTFFTRFVPSTQPLADELLSNLSEEHVLCPGLVDFEADIISLGYQPAIVRLVATRNMKRYEHEKCAAWHIPTQYKIHSEANMAVRHMCKPCKSLYHTVKQTLAKISNTKHDASSDSSVSPLVSPSPNKSHPLLSPRGKFPPFDNVRRTRKGKRKGSSKQKSAGAMDTSKHSQNTSSPVTSPLAGKSPQISSGIELESHGRDSPYLLKHARTGSSTSSYSPDVRYVQRDVTKDSTTLATVYGLTNSITEGTPSSEGTGVLVLANREGDVFKFPVEMGIQSPTHTHVQSTTHAHLKNYGSQTFSFESGDVSSPSPPTIPLDYHSPDHSHIIIRNSTTPYASYVDNQSRSPQDLIPGVPHRSLEFRSQVLNRDVGVRESSLN